MVSLFMLCEFVSFKLSLPPLSPHSFLDTLHGVNLLINFCEK